MTALSSLFERFLIVDDSPAIRAVLKEILYMRGVRDESMLFVKEGDKALEAFRKFQPDITFMDINMPGMQGDEAAKLMLHEKPQAYIIGVTGLMPSHDQVRNMVSVGVFDVIQKPVRKGKVDDVLEEIKREKANMGRIQ